MKQPRQHVYLEVRNVSLSASHALLRQIRKLVYAMRCKRDGYKFGRVDAAKSTGIALKRRRGA
jgi:hypothetical protein